MITHRGISVITLLPFGGGEGGGADGCKCKVFSLIILFYNREGAEYEVRRGPSTFENMPFLHVEDALLGARKACS